MEPRKVGKVWQVTDREHSPFPCAACRVMGAIHEIDVDRGEDAPIRYASFLLCDEDVVAVRRERRFAGARVTAIRDQVQVLDTAAYRAWRVAQG